MKATNVVACALALAMFLAVPAWASEDLDAFDNMVRDPGTFKLAVYLDYQDFPDYVYNGDSYAYHSKAYCLNFRGAWFGPKIAGSHSWGIHGVVPFMKIEAEDSDSQTGMGDIGIGPFLYLYENHKTKLYIFLRETIYAPTGKYDSNNDGTSPGYDAWRFRHLLGLGWYPAPFGLDWRIKYVNFLESDKLNYKYADSVETDIVLHYTLDMGLTLGVVGTFLWDVGSMEVDGQEIENTKGYYYSVGPNVLYPLTKDIVLSARWLHDIEVDNCSKGDTFYLRMLFYF